jgi:hypothetical protein
LEVPILLLPWGGDGMGTEISQLAHRMGSEGTELHLPDRQHWF